MPTLYGVDDDNDLLLIAPELDGEDSDAARAYEERLRAPAIAPVPAIPPPPQNPLAMLTRPIYPTAAHVGAGPALVQRPTYPTAASLPEQPLIPAPEEQRAPALSGPEALGRYLEESPVGQTYKAVRDPLGAVLTQAGEYQSMMQAAATADPATAAKLRAEAERVSRSSTQDILKEYPGTTTNIGDTVLGMIGPGEIMGAGRALRGLAGEAIERGAGAAGRALRGSSAVADDATRMAEQAARDVASNRLKGSTVNGIHFTPNQTRQLYYDRIQEAPEVTGHPGLRVFDWDEHPTEFVQQVAGRQYATSLVGELQSAYDGLWQAITTRLPGLEPAEFRGLILQGDAAAVNMPMGDPRKGWLNQITINPFTSWQHVGRLPTVTDDVSLAAEMATDIIASVVHELAHQKALSHGETYAGALTDFMAYTARTMPAHIQQVEQTLLRMQQEGGGAAWREFLDDAAEWQSRGPGARLQSGAQRNLASGQRGGLGAGVPEVAGDGGSGRAGLAADLPGSSGTGAAGLRGERAAVGGGSPDTGVAADARAGASLRATSPGHDPGFEAEFRAAVRAALDPSADYEAQRAFAALTREAEARGYNSADLGRIYDEAKGSAFPTPMPESVTPEAAVMAPPAPPRTPPPPAPPDGPRPTGPAEGAPLFKDNTERLLASAKDAGIDEDLARYAAAQIAVPTPEQHPALKAWNALYRVITPSAARNPVVHQAEIAASRYADAQQARILETTTGLMNAIKEAFGTADSAVLPQLRTRYRGDVGRQGIGGGATDQVGTIRHALENPSEYSLTAQQRRASAEWRTLLNKDTQQTRGIVGFGDDAAPLWQEATGSNTAVTDLAEYLNRRLSGAAAARTEGLLLKELAEKAGGRRLLPNGVVPKGMESVVSQSGRAWVFPKEVAQDVKKALAGPQFAADDSALTRAVDEIKAVLLNVDGSVAFGRQGMLSFTADPIGTLRDWGTAALVVGTKEGKAQWLSQNADRLRYWSQRGLQMNVTPTDVARPLAGGKAAKPLIDRALPPLAKFNEAQYGVVMPVLKMHRADTLFSSLQAMRDSRGIYKLNDVVKDIPVFGAMMRRIGGADELAGMTDDQLAEVAADAVNNWLGGADWAKIGQRGAVPRIGFLTEGWMRGQINTVKNAATFGTAEGILARRLILSDLAAWTLLATGGSLALSDKLPDYDPRSGNFLAIVTPAGYIHPPQATLYRTLARLWSSTVAEPFAAATGRKLPDVKQSPDNAASRWMQGKLGTLPRVIMDLHTGKDFLGRTIDNQALYFAQQVAPIGIQTITEDVRSGAWETEPGNAAIRAGLSLAGFTVRPPSAEERQMGLRARVPGLAEYDDVTDDVAKYLAQDVGDPALAEQLATWARTDDRTVEGRRKRLGIEQVLPDPALLEEYDRAIKQVRERMVRDNPALLRYLQEERLSWRDYESPTPTPSPTPTATPTPTGQPTATPAGTATKTPDPERTPKPGATPLVGAVRDEWAHRMSEAWGRKNPDGTLLEYNQMAPAERNRLDSHIGRLNTAAQAKYQRDWRGLTPAQQQVVEAEVEQKYGVLADQKPVPPPPAPTKTPFVPYRRPTATPGPDFYDLIYGSRTPTATSTPSR